MQLNQRKKARLPGKPVKKSFPIGKIFYYLSLLIFIGSIVYVLFFSSLLDVNSINIFGTDRLRPDQLKKIIASNMQDRYIGSINGGNIILLSKKKIEKTLIYEFGRLETVRVEKKFPSIINVYVSEKQLMFFVCSARRCFLIDREGNFKSEDEFRSDHLNRQDLVILGDLSNNPIDPEEDGMEQDYIDYVASLKNKLKLHLDLEIGNEFETPSRVSSDIRVRTAEGWKIFFNKDIEMDDSLEILKLFLENKIEKDKRQDLEYVDLRAENKIYYKFKEGTEMKAEKEEPAEPEKTPVEEKKKKKK